MAEPEDLATNKRKASPEDAADDAASKRVKLEDRDGDENAPPRHGRDAEVKSDPDGPLSIKEEQDGVQIGGSPTRAAGAQRPTEPRHSPEARRPSATTVPPTRRNVSVEEKKRGQRLFGGLVSTLSRTASGSQQQQQKRLEIERRQHERAQQRRADDEKRRAEKLEQLKKTRQIEQVKLDEQAMKTRHSALLAKAHSLQTRSEPKLYYLPWEKTRRQEDAISDQIRGAEETIDKERRDFKTRKEQRLRDLGVTPPPRSPSPPPRRPREKDEDERESESRSENGTVGEPKPPSQDTNSDAAAPALAKARSDPHDKDHDENGDEMMQDEEDVVIY